MFPLCFFNKEAAFSPLLILAALPPKEAFLKAGVGCVAGGGGVGVGVVVSLDVFGSEAPSAHGMP